MSRNEHDDRTSGGVPVTDELVQRLAGEAAAGYDVGALRRGGGRRRLSFSAQRVDHRE
jgi:hypothetical protein